LSAVEGEGALAAAVREGLTRAEKSLPAWVFYDAEGSALYERITELPEYYPTRTERAIFERYASEMVALAREFAGGDVSVAELGAGSASKTRVVLEAVIAQQGACRYVPIDVSGAALGEARAAIERALPAVTVEPFEGHHAEGMARVRALGAGALVLFIGSSIGNFEDADAVALLALVRQNLGPGGALLLGTDLRKSEALLVPAYDDAAGVTAAFNRNALARINRELGGRFDLSLFRHVALWNERDSRVEMHLESVRAQRVSIDALGLHVDFAAGERIHTESSVKYDLPRVDRLLGAAGFSRARTWTDEAGWFAVHLAEAGRARDGARASEAHSGSLSTLRRP
jgi:dimethylhistidine N-methyltransferase